MLVRKQCSFSWFMRRQTCDQTHKKHYLHTQKWASFVPHNVVCISAKKLTVYKIVQSKITNPNGHHAVFTISAFVSRNFPEALERILNSAVASNLHCALAGNFQKPSPAPATPSCIGICWM